MGDVLLPQFYVKLDGSDLHGTALEQLRYIEVDLSLHMPGMAAIELMDPQLQLVDDTRFKVGAELEVGVAATSQVNVAPQASVTIFKGLVTSIEAVYHVDGLPCVLVVRAYDKLHGLHRGTTTMTYMQSTDSDIVRQIAGSAGLGVQAETTSAMHEHVFQGDLSPYDFVQALARRNGFVAYCDNNTLHWKPVKGFNFPEVELAYGDSLTEFRPVLSSAGQVGTVQVQGWDPKSKEAVTTSTNAVDHQLVTSGFSPSGGPATAEGAFGSAKLHVGDHVRDTATADALAKAVFDRMAAGDITAEGAAIGNAAIKPGAKMRVSGVGTRFGGSYLISRVRHTFTPDEAYRTHFWLGGMTSGTLNTILHDDPKDVASRSHLARGIAVGIVTRNEDDANQARVKVKFPWLSDSDESTWAPVVGLGAGEERGLVILPEVNDEVLVAFANGDLNQPYVLGGVWNGVDSPPAPKPVERGKVEVRQLKTRAGHILRFTDKDGQEKIELIDKSGRNTIVIETSSNKIAITADGLVEVVAKQDVKIDAAAKVDIKAGSDVKVAGVSVNVEASGKLALKAPIVEINGTGSVKIAGPMVQIN